MNHNYDVLEFSHKKHDSKSLDKQQWISFMTIWEVFLGNQLFKLNHNNLCAIFFNELIYTLLRNNYSIYKKSNYQFNPQSK